MICWLLNKIRSRRATRPADSTPEPRAKVAIAPAPRMNPHLLALHVGDATHPEMREYRERLAGHERRA